MKTLAAVTAAVALLCSAPAAAGTLGPVQGAITIPVSALTPGQFVQVQAACTATTCDLYALDAEGKVWFFAVGAWWPLPLERGRIDAPMR
jgi:hypothetical protein